MKTGAVQAFRRSGTVEPLHVKSSQTDGETLGPASGTDYLHSKE